MQGTANVVVCFPLWKRLAWAAEAPLMGLAGSMTPGFSIDVGMSAGRAKPLHLVDVLA